MPTYREKRLVTRIKVTNIKGIYKQLVYFNTSFLTVVITNQEQCVILDTHLHVVTWFYQYSDESNTGVTTVVS